MKRLVLVGLLVCLLPGCGKKEEPAPPPQAVRPAAAPPAPAPAPAPAAAPAPEPAPAPAPAPEPPPKPVLKPAAAIAAPTTGGEHTVAKGETLYSIARQHHLDLAELARWNALADPTHIREGQVLRLTAAGDGAKPEPGTRHVVAKGETLFSIARRYGLKVEDLARLNGLADPAQIKAGQSLRLSEAQK